TNKEHIKYKYRTKWAMSRVFSAWSVFISFFIYREDLAIITTTIIKEFMQNCIKKPLTGGGAIVSFNRG
ncbi:MAG: hypothetical protein QM529_07480, partial [Hydrotalea sp.]|nr:hypothetical protein [Hydrotalea sp.]